MNTDIGNFPHAQAQPITDVAYSLLYDLIVQGRLRPGQKLTVKWLSEELGISRTPVHDALLRLASDSLIVIEPRKGTYVSSLTPERMEQIMDVRCVLELLACETAILQIQPPKLERLKAINHEMRSGASRIKGRMSAEQEHAAKNGEFHDVIVEASGNDVLLEIYNSLKAHVIIARAHIRSSAWKDRVASECDEHAKIIKALEARNLTALKSAVAEHLSRSKDSLVKDMKDFSSGKVEKEKKGGLK